MDRRAFDSFGARLTALDLEPDNSLCIPVPKKFVRFLIGAIMPLRWHDLWDGQPEDVNLVTSQVDDFLATLIIKTECPQVPVTPGAGDGQISRETCNAAGFGGAIIIEGDDEMGQVVTDVQLVDGKIRVFFGPCCFNDLVLTDIIRSAEGEDVGDTPLVPSDGTPVTYSSCGKALALVDVLYKVLEGAYSALDDFPWNYVSSVQDFVGYDLKNVELLGLIADWIVGGITAGITFATINDPVERQDLTCKIADYLPADATGVTKDQFDHIWQDVIVGPLPNIIKSGFMSEAWLAIGQENANTIAKLGATKSDEECPCPEGDVHIFQDFGQGLTWFHVFDFRLSTLPPGYDFVAGVDTQHTPGIGLWALVQGTNDKTTVGIRFPVESSHVGTTITRTGLAFKTLGDDVWDGGVVNVLADNAARGYLTRTTMVNFVGDNPSAAGVWELVRSANVPFAENDPLRIDICVSCQHPPDTNPPSSPDVSNIIFGCAIGGTGNDPWPSLP